jgi:hypothetical protein
MGLLREVLARCEGRVNAAKWAAHHRPRTGIKEEGEWRERWRRTIEDDLDQWMRLRWEARHLKVQLATQLRWAGVVGRPTDVQNEPGNRLLDTKVL